MRLLEEKQEKLQPRLRPHKVMKKTLIKKQRFDRRKARVRGKINGTSKIPRLSVFKSNIHIYAQLIDDDAQKTLAGVSDLKIKKDKMNKVEIAEKIGEEIAKLAIKAKIKKAVFDRNGFAYHGRVRAVAEGARKGGLEF